MNLVHTPSPYLPSIASLPPHSVSYTLSGLKALPGAPPFTIISFNFLPGIRTRPFRASCSLSQASDRLPSVDMAGNTEGYALYSFRDCKIIHLVRHAQGYHNVAGEHDYSAYESYDYFDASLTPLGWKQVDLLRKHVANSGVGEGIELVVTSPLMRTMQTAVGTFGGKQYMEGDPKPPLMIAHTGKSDHVAISSSGCPPFIAVESCREHLGVHPCDKRQPISTYRSLFPCIDFSEVETDEDTLWKPHDRETEEEIKSRGRALITWLLKRRERRIAVVSHSSYLNHLLSLFGHDCAPPIQKELWKGFTNCEMRTVVLANRGILGNPIQEDYEGGIPSKVVDAGPVENGSNN